MAPSYTSKPVPAGQRDRHRTMGLTTDETMPVLLSRAAHRLPAQEAIVDLTGPAVRRFTYADAFDQVVGLASHLRRSGVGAGDLVMVQAPNSAEAVLACWAAWHLGAVVNPVVDIYREHELRHILAQARPDAVVSVAEHRGFGHAEAFDSILAEADLAVRARVVLDGDGPPGWIPFAAAVAGERVAGAPATVHPDDPTLLLFTSGTTSLPKGAVHSSRTLVAETLQMANGWSFGWMDRMHLPLPIAHITGVLFALTVPMYRAGTVVLSRMVSMQQAVDEVVEHGVTTTASAPHAIPLLAEAYERAGISSIPLKVLASGGTTVPKVLIEQGEAIGVRPCRIYGMTELPTVTMPCPADTPRQRLETDGRLAPGVDCEAVDPDSRAPLPSGTEGELRVRGPERMLGYLDPEQTDAQIDADGWFHTGDLGIVDSEGCVTVTGRIKDIINRGGEKFSCRDVEDLLVGHPSIAAAAVVAAPDRRFGEVPAAYVVTKEDVTVDTAGLVTWLLERGAARQKAPVHWRVVNALPVNASGKVKKFELTAALAAELADGG